MRLFSAHSVRYVALMFCGFVVAACFFAQAAKSQPPGTAPVAKSVDAGTPDAPKPTYGIAVKPSDCKTWDAWLGWVEYRPLAMGAGVAFSALVLLVLTAGKPQRLLLGQDNRYSNSKCQMALWFFIVISAYLTVFLVRLKSCVVGGIGIPPHLLVLSGFSAVTFVGAKAITTSKVNNAQAMLLPNPKPMAPSDLAPGGVVAVVPAVGAPAAVAAVVVQLRSLKYFIGDLTTNDGLKVTDPASGATVTTAPTMDIGDTQMIVIAFIAVLTYLMVIYNYLGTTNFGSTAGVVLPDVDSTLLSLFGLGQGAYLSKKAVGNAGES